MSQKVGITYEEFIKGISAVGYRWAPESGAWRLDDDAISDEALRDFIRSWPALTPEALRMVQEHKRGFSLTTRQEGPSLIVTLVPNAHTNPLTRPSRRSYTRQEVEMGRELHALVASWQVGVPFARAQKMISQANPNGPISATWVRVASNLLREHQQIVLENRRLVQEGDELLRSAFAERDEEPDEE